MIQLRRARPILDGLVAAFAPGCERIEPAGSVRRREQGVNDLEIVAIPRYREEPADGVQVDLFAPPKTVLVNELHELITELSEGLTRIRPVKPSTPRPADPADWTWDDGWERKRIGEAGYFRLWIPRHEVQVDVWMSTAPAQWGAMFAIRTGSKQFSHALVKRWTAMTKGHCHGNRLCPRARPGERPYAFHHDGTPLGSPIDTPEERDVFEALRLDWSDWRQPWRRTPAAAARVFGPNATWPA